MKTKQDNKTTYTVGFVHGAVFDKPDAETGEENLAKRGDVREGVDVNRAAVFQATNRGRILGSTKDDKKVVAEAVESFKAEVKAEDAALKKHADEQLANSANLAAQVKNLQAELAEMRRNA